MKKEIKFPIGEKFENPNQNQNLNIESIEKK